METWFIEGGKLTVFVLLLAWAVTDFKSRIEKAMESFTQSLAAKADKTSAQDIETRLSKQIDKIEERQVREVEGLRTEMGDLRTHLDRRLDQLVGMLQK